MVVHAIPADARGWAPPLFHHQTRTDEAKFQHRKTRKYSDLPHPGRNGRMSDLVSKLRR